MAVLPITRATVGDALSVSQPSISNTSLQIKPIGISAPITQGVIASYSDLKSVSLNLNLSTSVTDHAGSSVRFTFDGAVIQPLITLGNQTSYGNATVKKGADALRPAGVDSQSFGSVLIIPQGRRRYDLDLSVVKSETNSKNIYFHYGPIVIAGVSIGDTLGVTGPKLINAFNIRPNGIAATSDQSRAHFIYENNANQRLIDINLIGPLQADRGVRFNFGGASPVTQAGAINQFSIGVPGIKNTSAAINVASIAPQESGTPRVNPVGTEDGNNQYGVLDFDLLQANQPKNSLNIAFSFFSEFQVTNIGFESSAYGLAGIRNKDAILNAAGWQSSFVSMNNSVINGREVVAPAGFDQSAVPSPNIINAAVGITVTGIGKPDFSNPTIYNLKQFAKLAGRDQSLYGIAYVQGGVKWLYPESLLSYKAGSAEVVNTTANQKVTPVGVKPLDVPSPTVTPRMIYPAGINQSRVGNPSVLEAAIIPKGYIDTSYGNATVWYHTRTLSVAGIDSYQTGYPQVFDPTQFVQVASFVQTAVFGDTAIKNAAAFISVASIDSLTVSEWVVAENKDRSVFGKGYLSSVFGNQSIANKSPSIFFEGLPAPVFNAPAVGHRQRYVSPAGFDRLLLGTPVLTKTPELKPSGFVATQSGNAVVSNFTRVLTHSGIDQSKISDPTVWFRCRYINTNSWQSSRHGNHAITHGVREIIGAGFNQQGYGLAWVSPGTRLIEPLSIYKEYSSSHFVGRHQEIKPFGFVAAQFGTRIIPESLSLFPEGFVGSVGLASIGLKTRYLQPKGYLTAGDQPAFRWGNAKLYNSVQYIDQYYISGSGLVPPSWPEWTLIENRNKVIGAVGVRSDRFGYSQTDNNADPLSPNGISPPSTSRTDVSMVSHAIRKLAIEGIEPPFMSSWSVAYNAARVIKPNGFIATDSGNATIKNTRRYYGNIGAIESLEFSTPMIAFRIRTIDIETRYSIAPPYIQLPQVELLTRYVSFQGFETVRYGLASLSIHLRLITPRWTHRNSVGEPILKNVTPNLFAYGHDSSEFGNSSIRTQWRDVYAQGDNASLFGSTVIADSKQYIGVRGWQDMAMSQKHNVIKTGTNPYVTQNIWLNDETGENNDEGKGIAPPNNQVSKASLNQNVLYAKGFEATIIGGQLIWSNNLYVSSGIGPDVDSVSKTATIFNKTQRVSMDESHAIKSKIAVGKPRMSPHTIWAVVEAPQQAIDNHDNSSLHYVGQTDQYAAGERFGQLSIESTKRSIYPYWRLDLSGYGVGRPGVDLLNKVIKPESFRSARLGLPSIPFSLQTITVRAGIYDPLFGYSQVVRPPYYGPQTISPAGLNSLRIGQQYADNFVRSVYPIGLNALSMGASKQLDTPYMWQGLRIGERVPLIISGGETLLMGDTTISLYIREIQPVGFIALSSGYNLSSFDERMTVTNDYIYKPDVITVGVLGINPPLATAPDIMLGQRYIRPDGNSDQFRKGGYHA